MSASAVLCTGTFFWPTDVRTSGWLKGTCSFCSQFQKGGIAGGLELLHFTAVLESAPTVPLSLQGSEIPGFGFAWLRPIKCFHQLAIRRWATYCHQLKCDLLNDPLANINCAEHLSPPTRVSSWKGHSFTEELVPTHPILLQSLSYATWRKDSWRKEAHRSKIKVRKRLFSSETLQTITKKDLLNFCEILIYHNKNTALIIRE